jgi:hypothetical protein
VGSPEARSPRALSLLPEPTKAESRTLLLGAVLGLVGYSAECVTLAVTIKETAFSLPVAAIPSAVAVVVGGLMCIGCAMSLACRAEGTTLRAAFRPHRPSFRLPSRFPSAWFRAFSPSYLRLASRVVRWNATTMLAILAALVMISVGALVLAIVALIG